MNVGVGTTSLCLVVEAMLLFPSVKRALLKAGWLPWRRVEVRVWEDHYALQGIQLHVAARRLLESYGGLRLEASGWGWRRARLTVSLDPLEADGQMDWAALRKEHGDQSLFPIGEASDGHGSGVLLMDPSGRVFMHSDGATVDAGIGFDAVRNLVEGRYT